MTTTELHNIREDVSAPPVPLDQMTPHPKNYNKGDIPKIAESLRMNGQYRGLVVQASTGHICAGNNTWAAAKSLGWTHIAADVLDLSDEIALRILAVDNLSARGSEFDDRSLAELMLELQRDYSLEGTGWEDADLDKLLDDLDRDSRVPEEEASTDDAGENVWGVVVICSGEDEQVDLLERLEGEGLKVRAMVA